MGHLNVHLSTTGEILAMLIVEIIITLLTNSSDHISVLRMDLYLLNRSALSQCDLYFSIHFYSPLSLMKYFLIFII